MLTVMQYQSEHTIGFDFLSGQLMVNATEMAKPFGKSPMHWLRNKDSQEYIAALESRFANLQSGRVTNMQLVKTINGGNSYGTWLHQKLALRFAQWLSPEFAIWVDEKIEELLTKGRVELAPMNQYDFMRLQIQLLEDTANRVTQVEASVRAVETSQKRIEAKVTTINDEYFTISGWYKLIGRRWDLTDPVQSQQMGKRLTKISQLNGFEVHKTYDAKYGKVNTYHRTVLESVISEPLSIS